ncbi:MAG: anthranilate phosphoribosyltransferase [Candidatus Omnitrophica bacterium]|nr:anthranilate phosphoribosyltransferase [Candidatus Omnitrophota bacterium]
MSALVDAIAAGPLDEAAMTDVMERMMTQAMPPEEVGAVLRALAARGETAAELIAGARVLRRHATPLPLSAPLELGDTCGTGGDQRGTINVSTLAALAASACGVGIAKHGNRAASSRCGSADVLEALGLNLAITPARVGQSIEHLGFGFCFAPLFHPAMKAVAPIRKELGIRTIFNLLGPLANPAPLTFQLLGVSDRKFLQPLAEAMLALEIRRGLVVHGLDGLDEVTTTGETEYLEIIAGAIRPGRISPDALGVPRGRLETLQGGDVQRNAAMAREVLSGAPSPCRDLVALNAGCVLYVAQAASTIDEGMRMATAALKEGHARRMLDDVVAFSKASERAR